MEFQERKLNKVKVAATILIFILIVFLIRFLTIKKEATYVSNENLNISTDVAMTDKQENVWSIRDANNSIQDENAIANNVIGNKIEINSILANNVADGLNTLIPSNVIGNDVVESNVIANDLDGTNIVKNPITGEIVSDNNTLNNTSTNTIASNVTDNTITNTNIDNTTNANTTNTTEQTTTQAKDSTKTKTADDFKGVIWLTFDDGPSAITTPKILDILKKYNVKATFFVLNYSTANEALIKREVAEGHTIGIHGYSHEYSKIYKSKTAFWNNIYTLQDKIKESTGVKSMYMRFPGGSSNTVSRKYKKGIMTELTKEAVKKGFKYFDWNVSSGDAGGAKTAKGVYKNVKKGLNKERGNMVLCHDIHQITLDALEDIIKYAKKKGYVFKAIDDDTPMITQRVNN